MALVRPRLAPTRRWALLFLTVTGALAFAGCSTGQTTAISTPTTLSTATTTTTDAVQPSLGVLAGIFSQGKGFGEVRPSEFYNGGDPTGRLTHVVWKSWGGPRALGTGVSEYVAPDQDVAEGTEQPARIIAFKLGSCFGDYVYQAVEWFFPQHGGSFNPAQYENVCTGAFVTVAPAARACSSRQIKAANGPFVGGASGEMSMTITLVNSGPGPCWLYGYPRLRLVTATGTTLGFSQTHSNQYIMEVPPRRVLLGVGAMAYVEIAKYRCDLGVIRTASQVQLTLPGPSEATTVPIPTRVLSYCKGGPRDPGNAIAFTAVESSLGQAQP